MYFAIDIDSHGSITLTKEQQFRWRSSRNSHFGCR